MAGRPGGGYEPGRVADLAMLDRMCDPAAGGFPADLAKYILTIDFSPAEHARFADLSDRVQLGTLSAAERAELEDLTRADGLLTVIQCKARISLRSPQPSVA